MGFGLNVSGDAGNVQVDSAYQNLVLVKCGYITLTNGNNEGYNTSSDPREVLTVSGVDPVIAIQYHLHTRTFRRDMGSGVFEFHILGGSSASVRYFVFDTPVSQPSQDFGMKVFGPGGAQVFDSGYRPMRVLGSHSGSAAPWPLINATEANSTNITFTYSHGNLAVITCQQAAKAVTEVYDINGMSMYESYINTSRSKVDGSSVVVTNSMEMSFPLGISGIKRWDLWSILVVDVSGYPSSYSV